MNYKLIGAVCVIIGCGSCGFMIAGQYLSKIRLLQSLVTVFEYMECELQYRCTPLPQLCRQAANCSQGKVQRLFLVLADELDAQVSPNAAICMQAALDRVGLRDTTGHWILCELGNSLGRFDLNGQLRALLYVRNLCNEKLEHLMKGRDSRLRSYQTLGLCAGAALAILLV